MTISAEELARDKERAGDDRWRNRLASKYIAEVERLQAENIENMKECHGHHKAERVRLLDLLDAKDTEIARLKATLDDAGKLSDWINSARSVIESLMEAYARRIRSECTAEQLALEPWRCMEFVAAESVLREQPVAVVDLVVHEPSDRPTSFHDARRKIVEKGGDYD